VFAFTLTGICELDYSILLCFYYKYNHNRFILFFRNSYAEVAHSAREFQYFKNNYLNANVTLGHTVPLVLEK